MDKAHFKQTAEDGDSERPSAHKTNCFEQTMSFIEGGFQWGNGDISRKGSYLMWILLPLFGFVGLLLPCRFPPLF